MTLLSLCEPGWRTEASGGPVAGQADVMSLYESEQGLAEQGGERHDKQPFVGQLCLESC